MLNARSCFNARVGTSRDKATWPSCKLGWLDRIRMEYLVLPRLSNPDPPKWTLLLTNTQAYGYLSTSLLTYMSTGILLTV